MTVWVRLYFKPSGLRCEMTVTPLEWVLGRDSGELPKPRMRDPSFNLLLLSSTVIIIKNKKGHVLGV